MVSEPPSSKTRAAAEHAPRHFQGPAIDAAGHRAAAVADVLVVGPRQPGQAVEQQKDRLALLGQAAGPFEDQLGDADVGRRFAVGAAGDHLGLDQRAPHVGHFLGPFVDEQHYQVHFGMIRDDGLGDVLEQDGLAGARRSDDQAALALADGREQIHDAGRERLLPGFQMERLVRIDGSQAVEVAARILVGGHALDGGHVDQPGPAAAVAVLHAGPIA